MKTSKVQIKFAMGVSGKFIVVSGVLMIVWLFVLTATGCMPSRVKERGEFFDPHRLPSTKEERNKIFKFFYCTDRTVTDAGDPQLSYGTELADEIRLGTFELLLAPERDLRGNNPDKWAGIEARNIHESGVDTFFNQLGHAVESSPQRSLVILVFGYRNSFRDTLLKTGKLAVSVDINTPYLVFDWPADQRLANRGHEKAFSYAKKSGYLLGELITAIIEKIKPQKLWLGGGSMGAQTICNAFRQMMTHHDLADPEKEIDHVFLAAPDVGVNEFDSRFKDAISALAKAVTVYVSSNDRALLLSQWIHGEKRLGQARTKKQEQLEEMIDLLDLEATGAKEITVIDVSPINRATLGHTFYIESSEFYDDLYQRLRNPRTVNARRLYPTHYRDNAVYWIMQDDEE
ncbi:MAG: alpha/beta hydrolase [Deltaproteobacteria bacterium]|nr:alpha/beta hydrolase [Deltaproteobacteria bacterium]